MGNMEQRAMSRKKWTDEIITANINSGSLQRIADACEAMTKRYTELIRERDYYKDAYESAQERYEQKQRKVTALRGWITRLKKRLA